MTTYRIIMTQPWVVIEKYQKPPPADPWAGYGHFLAVSKQLGGKDVTRLMARQIDAQKRKAEAELERAPRAIAFFSGEDKAQAEGVDRAVYDIEREKGIGESYRRFDTPGFDHWQKAQTRPPRLGGAYWPRYDDINDEYEAHMEGRPFVSQPQPDFLDAYPELRGVFRP